MTITLCPYCETELLVETSGTYYCTECDSRRRPNRLPWVVAYRRIKQDELFPQYALVETATATDALRLVAHELDPLHDHAPKTVASDICVDTKTGYRVGPASAYRHRRLVIPGYVISMKHRP